VRGDRLKLLSLLDFVLRVRDGFAPRLSFDVIGGRAHLVVVAGQRLLVSPRLFLRTRLPAREHLSSRKVETLSALLSL
jgi:hypothetical protein